MASFSALVRGGQAKPNLGARRPRARGGAAKPQAVGYGGTSGVYEHPVGVAGPGRVPDTQTVANRGGGLGGPATSQTPPPDVQTAAQRGGGLGGPSSYTPPPTTTQTVTQSGGGLGGARKKRTR